VGRVRPPIGGRAGLEPWRRVEAQIGETMNHRTDENQTKRPLAGGTGVGAVHLRVTNRERSIRFYREVVGLEAIAEDADCASLGVNGNELVVLHDDAARAVAEGTTGLYHLAIVVPTRKDLARVIARLMSMRQDHYPTDHVLTKSDYLWDPDGNGIEIYAETPEDGNWVIEDDGFYAIDKGGVRRSGRDPIDLEDLLGDLEPDEQLDLPLPAGSKMGHIHLHVRDVYEAIQFWSDVVGFDVTGVSRRFGVAFVSAGGYHHHLGLNTWAGQGAPPPPPDASGVRYFTIEVPTTTDLDNVAHRLRAGGVQATERSPEQIFTADPSGNRVRIMVRAQPSVL
jgi:catechol 2,3-dioxygenase